MSVKQPDTPQPPLPKQEQSNPGLESQMNPRPDYGIDSYKGYNRMAGKIAIITGGDSGIGRAVCVAYSREGCDIVCCYLNEHSDAQETKKHVEAAGRKCILVPGDISTDEQCKKIVDTCIKEFGRVDILVNNAAYQGKALESFMEFDRERIEHTFMTNIIAMFSLCKYCVPHMKKGSAIINTGSIQAYKPSNSILDYATTKGAIVAFTKGLAQELTSKGIRVNCVAPGPVWTPLVVASFPAEKIAEFGKNYPMGRPAQPVELAPAFVFLGSSDSCYISGEILAVTGGEPTA